VFGAIDATANPVGVTKKFKDADPFRGYLRETIMQRWLIYHNFKLQSNRRAKRVQFAQIFAVAAIAILCGVLFFNTKI
jgi:hypothetical protein